MCPDCWAALRPWEGPACGRCGVPFASEAALDSKTPMCADCRAGEFAFDAARPYGIYSGLLRSAILFTKFQGRERLGLKLGSLLEPGWDWVEERAPGELPLLVPVPLHASRQRERGFNQAELLAAGLRRALRKRRGLSLRLDTRVLRRIRPTKPQTGLDLRQRKENVRGVFGVAAPQRVEGRVVVLVDDVMTTGATASACAEALQRAGAGKVLALTLARATPQFPDDDAAADREPVDDASRAR